MATRFGIALNRVPLWFRAFYSLLQTVPPLLANGAKTVLLLNLFMNRVFFAPFAKLFELYFSLNQLFVFSAPVIYSLTILTLEFY